MTKPLYKSTTIQAAVSSFAILLINTAYSTWQPDQGKFRAPTQVEIATVIGGAWALKETIEGRKRAVEPVGRAETQPNFTYPAEINQPLTNEELLQLSGLTPDLSYIETLPSAEYANINSDFEEVVDNEEDDSLGIDISNLKGKYKLVAKENTKLKTSAEQSNFLASSDWVEISKGQVVEIDGWKFLKELNSHIQVEIDEYKNINGGVFYVFAPHFDLLNTAGNKVEIEAPTSPVQVISKNKTKIKLPGYQSTFYLEDPIYPGSSFMWYEATKNGTRVPPTKQVVDNIILQARNLDKLREFNGNKPLVVTSWYRDPRSNAAVGGATRSDHLTGRSTDLFCPSMGIGEFQKVVMSFWKFGGIGKGASKGFVHCSSDGAYRVWDY